MKSFQIIPIGIISRYYSDHTNWYYNTNLFRFHIFTVIFNFLKNSNFIPLSMVSVVQDTEINR